MVLEVLGDNMQNNSIIISAFPGMGKSTFYKENKVNYSDSDSSKFNKKEFPENYIQHIKNTIQTKQLIFVSSHIEVRNALVDNNLKFIYVLPSMDRKIEFLHNYKERGSSEEFIANVERNWERWLQISLYNQYPTYICKIGYLKDNMEGIIKEYKKFYNIEGIHWIV